MAQIIDGKAQAAQLRTTVREAVAASVAAGNRPPRIDVVRVGDDPASEVYVRTKEKMAIECGMDGRQHHLSAAITADELKVKLRELNDDDAVDAILLQLPLPDHLDEEAMIHEISANKDVDGFHRTNIGRLTRGEDTVVACTPAGIIELIKSTKIDLEGAHAVVIGRSNIVGKPVALLLLQENCTVTVVHSRTREIDSIVKQADIVVAAVGRAEMVKGSWIKPGAVVVDVGINRTEKGLVGDVAFDECDHAGYITPVPGGVGPMTIAMLLSNSFDLYQKGLTN